jgi:DNA-binding NarL/FixJ family response regulator
LQRVPEVTDVLAAGSLVQLLSLCAKSCLDLILFDLAIGRPTRGKSQPLADLICVIRRLCPNSQLVVMSIQFEAKEEALAAGANGFISKTAPPDEVLSAIIEFLKSHS